MSHLASESFWAAYRGLDPSLQRRADRSFELLKNNPEHPSLHLKKVGRFWSARIGVEFRALAVEVPEGYLWFWIGNHEEYERMLRT